MKKLKQALVATMLCGSSAAFAVPFSYDAIDVPERIPQDGTAGNTYSFIFNTVGATGTIADLNVYVDIEHTWMADLDIFITNTFTGTEVQLFDQYGGSGDDLAQVTFDDEAGTHISTVAAPFGPGTFQGTELLSAFDGESLSSVWQLTIVDNLFGDTGTLNAWGISGDTADSVSVAEPGTLALLGLGLAGLGFTRRRV